jgi:uncharacterized repeat protein (TIGR02543 family)
MFFMATAARRFTLLCLILWLIAGSMLGSRPAVSFASPPVTAGHLASATSAIVAADDSYELDEDTPLSVPAAGVLANDTAAEPLLATLVSAPAHGTVALAASGSFVYTPTVDYSGTDSFQYVASTGTPVATDAWAFDDGVNPTAGANGHSGTLLNSPTFTTTIPLSMTSGTAISFDGVDDGISVDSIAFANQSFSVAFWAKRSSIGTFDIVVGQGTGSTNTVLHIGFRASNVFTCAFWNNDLNTPSAYTDTDWHHWACTYDAATNQRALYRDGSLVAADTAPTDYQGSSTFWIGNRNNGDHFGGLVDDVRLYRTALTQAEVQAAMTGGPLHFFDSATVTLTVRAVNDAPVAQDDNYTTTQGTPLIPEASDHSLTTLFASNNGQDGNMFDVTAGARGITITSFDVHINATGMREIAVYYKPGSYVGSEQVAANWTLLGRETVSAQGTGNATPVSIGGLVIPAGTTYGLYVTVTDTSINLRYIDGANTYSDGVITITTGTGAVYPFGTVFSPRSWNGTIHYSINQGVLHNDSDTESQLSVALSTPPIHGALSLASNGTFIYTPTLAFAGQDSFTYIASDGVLTDTALVTVDITPIPCMVETTGDGLTDYSSADARALQTAISAASPGDLIKVAGSCIGIQTIDGLSQTLAITQSVSIQGGYTTSWLDAPNPGAPTTLDAEGNGRVVSITGPIAVTLDGLAFSNGLAERGAAVLTQNGASVTITSSRFDHNTAVAGSAIANHEGALSVAHSSFFENETVNGTIFNSASATAVITASSFYSNTATRGGGLYNAENGTIVLENNSFAYNQASQGGGVHNRGVMTATHNTFAYNSATFGRAIYTWQGSMALFNNLVGQNSGGVDCHNQGTLTASSGNLIQDGGCDATIAGDSSVGALGDYGGGTLSLALLPTSAAIDQADAAHCLADDQRGISRPQDSACDIGAYEALELQLMVASAGTGAGTITSDPAGINCGSSCTANFPAGMTISLTAAASPGSAFTGWSGACTGTASCVITLSDAASVTATFEVQHLLSITRAGTGTGAVTSAPAGINCGGACNASYILGAAVTLTATAQAGSTFDGWSGACTGTQPTCQITLDQARSVTATFTEVQHALSVTIAGAGTVTSTPAGINCGSSCTANFPAGMPITLAAAATPGSAFTGWSGACTGTQPTCQITLDQVRSVAATFSKESVSLYLPLIVR